MKVNFSMGTSRGRFPTDLLGQSAWRALTPHAQVLYMRLWIDESGTHAGTRSYSPQRLSRLIGGMSEDDVIVAAEDLQQAGFLTVDDDAQCVHLRGWIARDGLTRSKKMALPFRSAFDQIESDTIRASILDDLRASHEIDVRDHLTGVTSRAMNRARKALPHPDSDDTFWTHGYMSGITSQMPQEHTSTPLDGLNLRRYMPLALGRGDAQERFAALDVLSMWAYLTLYLRANEAGVVTGPAAYTLARHASGPSATKETIEGRLGLLVSRRWIDRSVEGEEAHRVRFFHLHEESPVIYKRGASVASEINRLQCDALRAGALSDLALALHLGVGGKATGDRTFWHESKPVWASAQTHTYSTADLRDRGIGRELPCWTDQGVGSVEATKFPWVPRQIIEDAEGWSTPETRGLMAMSLPGTGRTHRVTDTATHTVTDTATHRVTDTVTDRVTHLAQPADSGDHDTAHTVTDGVTGGVTDTPLITAVRSSHSAVRIPSSRSPYSEAPQDTTDGRTDGPHQPSEEEQALARAQRWVDALPASCKPISASRTAESVARRLLEGETEDDLDGLVNETLARPNVGRPGGYLFSVLTSDRPARETAHRSPGSSLPAARGAVEEHETAMPFTMTRREREHP